MQLQIGRTWILILMLALGAAARAQTTAGEVLSAKVLPSGNDMTARIQPILPPVARAWSGPGVGEESKAAPGVANMTAQPPETGKAALQGSARPVAPPGTASRVGFWSLQALMFGSVVAAAESTHRCIEAGSCTAIPSPFRTRGAMYNAGLPVAAGIAILSYEMRKHRNRWWYLPPAFVIAGDGVLTFHSARAAH